MVKAKEDKAGSELEALAGKLEALQREATDAGEERAAKSIGNAVKAARWEQKQRAMRMKCAGNVVANLQAKRLTAERVVARLTSGPA